MKVQSFGATDVGLMREHNEDSYLCDEELGLYIVADGMGGHAAGEVASAEAVDQVHGMVKSQYNIVEEWSKDFDNELLKASVSRLMESAIQSATYFIFGMAEVQPEQHGMGTTLSVLLVVKDRAVVAQVGDSRVYLIRENVAQQVTEDHTLVNLQLKMGAITPEQAKTANNGHVITRAVGVRDYVEVDTFHLTCQSGDRFLLCSDGLSDYLSDLTEVVNLAGQDSMADSSRALLGMALNRGGKDNITTVLAQFG
jgi:serine/threonine protein phosphatase PrpC